MFDQNDIYYSRKNFQHFDPHTRLTSHDLLSWHVCLHGLAQGRVTQISASHGLSHGCVTLVSPSYSLSHDLAHNRVALITLNSGFHRSQISWVFVTHLVGF